MPKYTLGGDPPQSRAEQILMGQESGPAQSRLEELLKNGSGGGITPEQIAAAVEAYLDEHPVTVTETDPTVPAWAKAANPPAMPQMATQANMSDWTSGKTVDAATLKTNVNAAVAQLSDIGKDVGAHASAISDLQTYKADKSEIPTKTSDLTNDSGFITASQVPSELPVVSASDNGKVLGVVNGAWAVKSDEGGSTITVDDALSTSSENPVQNKVVNAALDAKADADSVYTKSQVDSAIAKAAIDPATVAVDQTLTISGAAADAKVTGDGISTNKDDIFDLSTTINEVTTYHATWENGQINQNGDAIGAHHRRTVGFIPLNGLVFTATVSNGNDNFYLCEYDSNKNWLERNAQYGKGSISPRNSACAYVRGFCYSDSLPQATLEDYVALTLTNSNAVLPAFDEIKSEMNDKASDNAVLASDLLDGVTVVRENTVEIGATYNNDSGNTTYIFKNIVNNAPVNGAVIVKIGNVANARQSQIATVYFYNSSNTKVGEDGINATQAAKGKMFIAPATATKFTVRLYPSIDGGLTDTHAVYTDVFIGDAPFVLNYLDLIGKAEYPVPYYYFHDSYLPNKVSAILAKIEAASGNCDVFGFCTDQHWSLNAQKSPALIKYLSTKLNIPRLFMGGDYADGISIDALNAFKGAYKGKIYNIAGNHEYMDYFTENGDMVSQTITGATVWEYLNGGLTDAVVGVPNENYYYVDNATQKMRYIVLNVYTDGSSAAFNATEKTWLQTVLSSTPSGYTVVIFTHFYASVNHSTGALTPVSPMDEIGSVVDASSAEIACIIQGHTHFDGLGATTGGIPVFVTTCDKYLPHSTDDPWLSSERTINTITEQAFDVFVIDKTNKSVSAVRIGCPADNPGGSPLEIRSASYA